LEEHEPRIHHRVVCLDAALEVVAVAIVADQEAKLERLARLCMFFKLLFFLARTYGCTILLGWWVWLLLAVSTILPRRTWRRILAVLILAWLLWMRRVPRRRRARWRLIMAVRLLLLLRRLARGRVWIISIALRRHLSLRRRWSLTVIWLMGIHLFFKIAKRIHEDGEFL
jgi:hypothetical protein